MNRTNPDFGRLAPLMKAIEAYVELGEAEGLSAQRSFVEYVTLLLELKEKMLKEGK